MAETDIRQSAASLQEHLEASGVPLVGVSIKGDVLLVYLITESSFARAVTQWQGHPVETKVTGQFRPAEGT